MANIFLSAEQQGIVVFWMWKTLAYWKRMALSFACIFLGFLIQYAFPGIWILGVLFILAGNLFLLVRGYDNRVNLGKYSSENSWEEVAESKLLEVEQIVKKMRKWDRSTIDISNKLGTFTFIVVFFCLVSVFILGSVSGDTVFHIFAVDAAILLFPHWYTGKRDILSKPKLLQKIRLIKKLLRNVESSLQEQHTIEYFMLLKGKHTKVPNDIKFRVGFENQHPDFLGFYGQIVTNSVSGKVYPYFYVVLVAKKGYGLKRAFDRYSPSRKITKEFKKQGDVEVLVIRQTTTRTSGYYTNNRTMQRIFLEGLNVAGKAAVK